MSVAGEDGLSDLERYRAYLRLLAGADVDARLQGKIDLSGVVQQTLWEAHQDRARFNGNGAGHDESSALAWLRRILRVISSMSSAGSAQERRPRPRARSLEESSARLVAELEADDTSPSAHAARNERVFRIARALEQLPIDQRAAVFRHHLNGVPLADVAEELSRSKEAVAGLLHRGLVRLRQLLRDDAP